RWRQRRCNGSAVNMQAWKPKTSTKTSSSISGPTSGTRRRSVWSGTRAKPGPSPATSGSLPSFEPERRDWLEEAAQPQRPHRLGVEEAPDFLLDLGVEQDFPGPGLAAKARGQVRYVADRGVFPALLESDHAQGRLALRDADPQPDVVAEPFPGLRDRGEGFLQGDRHAHRALGGPVHRKRVAEEDHHAVAGEMLQRAAKLVDDAPEGRVVRAQELEHLLRIG